MAREPYFPHKRLSEAVRNDDTFTAERIYENCRHSWRSSIGLTDYCETALRHRCLPMVKLLLSQDGGFDYNRLIRAAVECDFGEGVEALQSKGGLLDKDSIYKCLEHNKPGVLKYILEHKILMLSNPNINSTPTSNRQLKHVETRALHCCIHGSIRHREPDKVLDCVKLLVEAGADLNKDKDGETPIYLAAANGMVTTVTYLAQRGASIAITQRNINILRHYSIHPPTSLLHCLASSGAKLESDSYDECLKLLMAQGVDINQLNSSNETPLYLAVENGNEGMVKSLISAHCDVNIKVDDYQSHMLSISIRRGDTAITEILKKAGVDINIADKNGLTPLLKCLQYGHSVGLAKLLIDNGADVNAQDNTGKCVLEYPYHWYTCHAPLAPDTVQMLINKGADIHKRGVVLLNKAVGCEDIRTTLFLIENGIHINTEDEHGDIPLGLAARTNNIELVTLLTSKGGDVNHQNLQGATALHKSADNVNGRSVTEILLKAGANVNLCDNNGRAAFMAAARAYNIPVLQCLLEAGSDINLCDNDGRTALMQAALECNRSVLQCLLGAGADTNITDPDKNSVIPGVMNSSIFDGRGRKWINCLKLLLINKCYGSLDAPGKNGETLFKWLLDKHEADLIWYLVTENCSLKGLGLHRFKDKFKFPDTLMLSKILFESGAPLREIWAIIKTSFLNNRHSLGLFKKQTHAIRDFWKSRSLQSRCRRTIRNCIGSGISSKITQLGLPQLLQDYVIMKDMIPEKYFTLEINDEDDKDY
ncbi:putative ankyrin repeat protein RF_0381 [Patella vulgata]|uniref:putative ankyrin repeat protein RF_0381 n=1 Tax=Patella vulgata TaxID=6465 RepID=UPI0024A8DC95|nr:putative ankyrin repeat protein RF_0381 [Patella vulgata]